MPIIAITDAQALFEAVGGLTEAQVDQKLRDMAESAADKWRREAKGALSRATSETYANAVKVLDAAPGHVVVYLDGTFPNWLEQGHGPWDLRTTVLQSPKAKRSRDGYRYMAIPFRHQTPGTLGTAGAPMGSQFGDQASAIGQRVHDAAKELRGSISGADAEAAIRRLKLKDPVAAARHAERLKRSTRGMLWGGIPELDEPGAERDGRLKAGHSPKLRRYHVTDIHAGMVRYEKTYAKAQGAHYMTFRMISENPGTMRDRFGRTAVSDVHRRQRTSRQFKRGAKVANWMHPGLKALNLVVRVVEFVEQSLIPKVFAPPSAE